MMSRDDLERRPTLAPSHRIVRLKVFRRVPQPYVILRSGGHMSSVGKGYDTADRTRFGGCAEGTDEIRAGGGGGSADVPYVDGTVTASS